MKELMIRAIVNQLRAFIGDDEEEKFNQATTEDLLTDGWDELGEITGPEYDRRVDLNPVIEDLLPEAVHRLKMQADDQEELEKINEFFSEVDLYAPN